VKKLITLPLIALALTGCGGAAVSYVSASDPVLAVCQAPEVQGNSSLVQSIDGANNTNPDSSWSGDKLSQLNYAQVSDLQHAAASYRQDAERVTGHPEFGEALLNEAQEFTVAAASPNGMTTNTVAVAADTASAEILDDCASFRVGTAPKPGKPAGPWAWGLTGIVLGGYLLMALLASYLIAVGQRSLPRKKRLAPAVIFWRSLAWWVFIFAAIARVWTNFIVSATLTADDKKNDRIAAQDKEIARLQKLADKLRDGE
jgi:hypothetical protein